jgi:hypothetical protein
VSNVIIIAKAIIALKAFLDQFLEVLARGANENARAEIARAVSAYEAAKTNKALSEAARQIQAGFNHHSGADASVDSSVSVGEKK